MKSQIHEHHKARNIKVTKFLITSALLITMVVSGLTSLHFFKETDYDLSSLLVIATYLSIVFGIYVVTMGNGKAVRH
jgi:L-asparagine transporter-like permease